jgi:hypothetical protein
LTGTREPFDVLVEGNETDLVLLLQEPEALADHFARAV